MVNFYSLKLSIKYKFTNYIINNIQLTQNLKGLIRFLKYYN